MNRPAKQRQKKDGHASKGVLKGVSKPYIYMVTAKVPGSTKGPLPVSLQSPLCSQPPTSSLPITSDDRTMALSFVCKTLAFAFLVTGVRGGCNTDKCCCPNSAVTSNQNSFRQVTFNFDVVPNSKGCNGSTSANYTCSIPPWNWNYTECTTPDYVYDPELVIKAKKDGDKVSVDVTRGCYATVDLLCKSGKCKTDMYNWGGTYEVITSNSKGVTFTGLSLLIASLSKLLI